MAGADPRPPRPPAEAAADERRSLFRALLVIALIGIALRLAFSLGYWVDKELTRDEREYLSLARSLAAGEGFVYDAAIEEGPVDPFGRPPGYPAFLAIAGGAGRPRLCCVLCAKALEQKERSWHKVACRSRPTHKGVTP